MSNAIKPTAVASVTSIALLLTGAILSGCTDLSVTRCDTTQAAGTCAVTVHSENERLIVCPVEESAVPNVCMNPVLDVQRANGAGELRVLLKPNKCQLLGADVKSATPNSCQAFVASKTGAK